MAQLFLLICIVFITGCVPQAKYSLSEANDYLKFSKNRDRDFSQGLKVTTEIPDATGATDYFFANIFCTPSHKELTTPQPDDRPYAGYTYIGSDFKYRKSETVQDVFGITAGIIGPGSGSKQIQNQVHRWLGQNTAKGWGNQLDNEVGIILKAERSNILVLKPTFNMLTTYGAHLGNVFTQGYGGAEFRFGRNLPEPFNTPGIIYPRLETDFDPQQSQWSFYLYGGPYIRAVAQNIFLDGNTFRDSQSVEKYPIVTEGRLGFTVEYAGYRFSYTYIFQSKEFTTQAHNNDFGEITLAADW